MRFRGSPTTLAGWSLRSPQPRTKAGVKIKLLLLQKREKI